MRVVPWIRNKDSNHLPADLFDAVFAEHIGKSRDFCQQLVVGHRLALARLVLLPDQSRALSMACFHMAVHTVLYIQIIHNKNEGEKTKKKYQRPCGVKSDFYDLSSSLFSPAYQLQSAV